MTALRCPQLPPEVMEKLEPFESYLGPYLEQVEKEKKEVFLVGARKM